MKDVVDQRLRALRQIGSEARQLLRDRLLAPFRSAHPSPVVVLGFQKSGTSAIAGLLGRATGLPTTIDFVGARSPYIDALRSGAEPFDSFVRKNALAFSRPIVKEPNLSVFIVRPTMICARVSFLGSFKERDGDGVMCSSRPRGVGIKIDPFQIVQSDMTALSGEMKQ